MLKQKRKTWLLILILLLGVYFFSAARPIPQETTLDFLWAQSLQSVYAGENAGEPLIPYRLGDYYGYVDGEGRFALSRILDEHSYVSLSPERWSVYAALPESLQIQSPRSQPLLTIDAPGYPLFLDQRIFLINSEQNGVSALDEEGALRWNYRFSAPLISMDAEAGMFLSGSVDGVLELMDSQGKSAFPAFEPGGSRLAIILGCALSSDAARIGLVSGIDPQRFLLLEKAQDNYRVVYHQFLGEGFRRNVPVAFVDQDRRVVYEQSGGVGVYDIQARRSVFIPLEGELVSIDESGAEGLVFIISSGPGSQKYLSAIRLPGTKIMESPFYSSHTFLSRRDDQLYVGGGNALISFRIGAR
jgi:hypothetical protein